MGQAVLSFSGGDKYYNYGSHFLEACCLCHKPLGHNSDIFMYRGNTPFCSLECRQEQIEIDEVNEKRWKRASSNSKRAIRQNTNDSTNEESTSNKAFRRSTVAVS